MRLVLSPIGAAAFLLTASPALATEFVKNGSFSLVQNGATSSRQMSSDQGTAANPYGTQYVQDWTSLSYSRGSNGLGTVAGYNFIVMDKGGADPAGTTRSSIATNDFDAKSIWGGPTANNGFALSKDGGNYLVGDGAFETSYIYQVLTGLTVGKIYDLTFQYAGAQQWGYDGSTTEGWKVNWSNASNLNDTASYSTAVLNNDSHGFTGWKTASTSFTATNNSQILSFLAAGTPDGAPPFSLLDGVSVVEHGATPTTPVPEPASWATMLVGFGAIGFALRRRRVGATRAPGAKA